MSRALLPLVVLAVLGLAVVAYVSWSRLDTTTPTEPYPVGMHDGCVVILNPSGPIRLDKNCEWKR